MRFKMDENIPAVVTDRLVQAGHDVVGVVAQGLGGVVDPAVAAVCLVEQRALITLDLDFADIRQFPPEIYAGIIVLRPATQTIPLL